MHNTCGNAKACKSYNFKCKYIPGLFDYLCHLDLTLRITLVETTALGNFFFFKLKSVISFLTEISFLNRNSGMEKEICFTVHICGG